MVIQIWVFGILFLEKKEPVTTGKQLTIFIANDKIEAFK